MQTPLQLLNAEVTFYRMAANGVEVGDVWMGGTAENLTLTETPKERIVEVSGMPYGKARHEEEEFGIEWESVWLHDGQRMPRIRREMRMVMVIVWSEPETGAWNRRTYYGVTARPQKVQTGPMHAVAFRAEWMEEDTGMGVPPAGPLAIPGRVWYRDGDVMVEAARMNLATGEVEVLEPDLIAFDFSTAGTLRISSGGSPMLTADGTGITVSEFGEFSGAPVATRGPRVEFWVGLRRMAVLTLDGKLLCALRETGQEPELDGVMTFRNPGWLFTLGAGAAWATRFHETL